MVLGGGIAMVTLRFKERFIFEGSITLLER